MRLRKGLIFGSNETERTEKGLISALGMVTEISAMPFIKSHHLDDLDGWFLEQNHCQITYWELSANVRSCYFTKFSNQTT